MLCAHFSKYSTYPSSEMEQSGDTFTCPTCSWSFHTHSTKPLPITPHLVRELDEILMETLEVGCDGYDK